MNDTEAKDQMRLVAGKRIALVVEDDLKYAAVIRVQLEAQGFQVLHAANAEDALVLAAQQTLSLVTLDILLPGIDGWDFLIRFKALPGSWHVPVVILSTEPKASKGFALGAAAILQKPVSQTEFSETLVDVGLLPRPGKGMLRVLVVDDDSVAVELIAVRLAGLASTVLRAGGGREGIDLAQKEFPDLIVLDLMMPEVNGFDVVEALGKHPETARIPILVVTSKEVSAEERVRLNASVRAIMGKSTFSQADFVAAVRRAMIGRKAPAA